MGIFAALISAVLGTSKDILSKNLSVLISSTTSALTSFLYPIPFYLIWIIFLFVISPEAVYFGPSFVLLVLLRASSDAVAEWMKMSSYKYSDLSTVASILSLSPAFLLLLSPVITKDPISIQGAIGVLLVVAGNLLITYKTERSTDSKWHGTFLAIGASFFFALNGCFDRLAVQTAHPVISGFFMTLIAGLIIFALSFGKAAQGAFDKKLLPILSARGAMEVGFMCSKLYALTVMSAPYVVSIQRLSIVFSVFAGHFYFKEKRAANKLIAAFIILSGTFLIALN